MISVVLIKWDTKMEPMGSYLPSEKKLKGEISSGLLREEGCLFSSLVVAVFQDSTQSGDQEHLDNFKTFNSSWSIKITILYTCSMLYNLQNAFR